MGDAFGPGDDVAPRRASFRVWRAKPKRSWQAVTLLPLVIEALDLGPVIAAAESRIRRDPEAPQVVADGRRRQAEPPPDLRGAQTARVELGDVLP